MLSDSSEKGKGLHFLSESLVGGGGGRGGSSNHVHSAISDMQKPHVLDE